MTINENENNNNEVVVETRYSTYLAAKKVNQMLKNDGIEKVIPAQMIYNYTTAKLRENKKPMIKCFVDEEGKTFINESDLLEWYSKYSKKARLLMSLND